MEQQGNAWVKKFEAAQWRLQQCERHRGVCSSIVAMKGAQDSSRGSFSFTRLPDLLGC